MNAIREWYHLFVSAPFKLWLAEKMAWWSVKLAVWSDRLISNAHKEVFKHYE